jgi:hypothetical protein
MPDGRWAMLAQVARISMLPAANEENFFYLAVIL